MVLCLFLDIYSHIHTHTPILYIRRVFPSLHLNFCILLVLGMKVYVTDEKELIMEPSIKWAGNPNVLVAVKAFGLKATVQVYALLC